MSKAKVSPEDAARFVVQTLQEQGHTAYYAGGCVRDRLLGRTPNDIDVATSALPEQVRELFRRTLGVGEQFGIVIVLYKGQQTEVATFRADGDYSDGRRPDTVDYTSDPAEDAQRRDFTVNGLFYDPIADETHDFVGGVEDIGRRQIRAIGDPARRFDEDKLRILRAPRFAAVLGFQIEERTADEARRRAQEIVTAQVSPERIRTELAKLLVCPGRAEGFALCEDLRLLEVVLPAARDDVSRTGRALAALPPRVDLPLAWATALHLASPDAADQALLDLRCSNKEREGAVKLLRDLAGARALASRSVADQKRLLRGASRPELIELLRVTSLAGDGDMAAYEYARDRLAEYSADEGPAGLDSKPLLQGRDLREAGIPPGPLYGRVLPLVEEAQLEGRVTTTAEALAFAQELISKEG